MKRLVLATLATVCIGGLSNQAEALMADAPTIRPADLTLGSTAAYDRANPGPLFDSLIGTAALTTVDQQNTTGGSSAGGSAPQGVGQSFTPAQATMNAVTLPLYSTTASTTVQLQVFAGAGFGGTLLATGTPVTFTNTTFQTIELPLATPLTLTPGTQYTFRANITAGTYFYSSSTTDVYSGGTRYSSAGGTSIAASDLVFAEGFDASLNVVPEPSTWAMLGLGVAGLSIVTLRRRVAVRA